MLIGSPLPPPTAATAPAFNTNAQSNAALASASINAQTITRPVETQTVRAPAPVGRADPGRPGQSATFVGRSYDAEAGVVDQKASRGLKLDIRV